MSLEQQRRFWVIFFTAIVLAAFILPFYLFDDLPKIYGAFHLLVITPTPIIATTANIHQKRKAP
ncbi:MAG: hypothetical protein GX244_06365 [Firmicutes bacterium]|nr:hypothetical protein [Bacillota bacterium]